MYGGLPNDFGFDGGLNHLDLAELAEGAGHFAMFQRPEWQHIQAAAYAEHLGCPAWAEGERELAGYGGLDS